MDMCAAGPPPWAFSELFMEDKTQRGSAQSMQTAITVSPDIQAGLQEPPAPFSEPLVFKFIIPSKAKHSVIVFQNELGYQESPEPPKEIPFEEYSSHRGSLATERDNQITPAVSCSCKELNSSYAGFLPGPPEFSKQEGIPEFPEQEGTDPSL